MLTNSVAVSGMTLLLVPAWMLPTVTTAGSARAHLAGDDRLEAQNRDLAARTTGSTAACGMEP